MQTLSMEDMMRILGFTRQTIARLMKQGKIPQGRKIGGEWRWLKSDIDAWLKQED